MSIASETPPASRSWWQRHWKWVLPVAAAVLCFGVPTAMLLSISARLKESVPYEESVDLARSSPSLRASIGFWIKGGWWVRGQLNASAGKVDMLIPVSGSYGSAEVHTVGTRDASGWKYTKMQATVHKTGQQIDLLTESRPSGL